MLDYAALSALAAVIREGTFERAALALHVTPSAVSQRIRSLEERVGCALVVRDLPCRATEAGRRLCQHVDRVRLLEQELQGRLPALAPEGVTRVALPIAVNADSLATWFAPAVAAFAADAPVLVERWMTRTTPASGCAVERCSLL
jgi:LysR family transcriptional regulator (chromosome initiation inhibitor)